jgi:hypothetical protein
LPIPAFIVRRDPKLLRNEQLLLVEVLLLPFERVDLTSQFRQLWRRPALQFSREFGEFRLQARNLRQLTLENRENLRTRHCRP